MKRQDKGSTCDKDKSEGHEPPMLPTEIVEGENGDCRNKYGIGQKNVGFHKNRGRRQKKNGEQR